MSPASSAVLVRGAPPEAFTSALPEPAARDVPLCVGVTKVCGSPPDNAGAAATDYMQLFGLVTFAYMWARMAKVAQDKIAASGATPYLKTKLVTGRFFVERMLPETALHLSRLQTGSATMMELAADAF